MRAGMKYALLALLLAVFAVAGAGEAWAAKNLSDLIVGKFVDEKTSASLGKDYGDEIEVSIEFLADGTARFNGLERSVEGTYSIDEKGVITVDFFEHWAEGELQDAYQEKYKYDVSSDSVLRIEIKQLFTRARSSSGRTFHWTAQDSGGYSNPEPDDPSYKPARPSIAGEIISDGVRLRTGHTTNAREIAKFSRGKKIAILQRYESGKEKYYWFKVNIDGREGWMYGEFLKIDEGAREGAISAAPPAAKDTTAPAQSGDADYVYVSADGWQITIPAAIKDSYEIETIAESCSVNVTYGGITAHCVSIVKVQSKDDLESMDSVRTITVNGTEWAIGTETGVSYIPDEGFDSTESQEYQTYMENRESFGDFQGKIIKSFQAAAKKKQR